MLYIHPDDGDVFTKICRRDRNCIAVYTMCEYVGFVNKICTGVKQFFFIKPVCIDFMAKLYRIFSSSGIFSMVENVQLFFRDSIFFFFREIPVIVRGFHAE